MQKLRSVLLVDDDPTSNFLNERLLLRTPCANGQVRPGAHDNGRGLSEEP